MTNTNETQTVDEIVEDQIKQIEESGIDPRVFLKTLLVEAEKVRQSANQRPEGPLSERDAGFYDALDQTFFSLDYNMGVAALFGQAPVIGQFEEDVDGPTNPLEAVLAALAAQDWDESGFQVDDEDDWGPWKDKDGNPVAF